MTSIVEVMSAGAVSAGLAALVLAGSIAAIGLPVVLADGRISGPARVVDGDSLVVDGRRVRLYGIDAPELHQTCGGDIYCGLAAKVALERAIGLDIVTCEEKDRDRYNRIVAVCRTASVPDLNALQVATGMAIAYTRYSHAYVDAEAAAKAENLGIWRTGFQPPEEYRRQR